MWQVLVHLKPVECEIQGDIPVRRDWAPHWHEYPTMQSCRDDSNMADGERGRPATLNALFFNHVVTTLYVGHRYSCELSRLLTLASVMLTLMLSLQSDLSLAPVAMVTCLHGSHSVSKKHVLLFFHTEVC